MGSGRRLLIFIIYIIHKLKKEHQVEGATNGIEFKYTSLSDLLVATSNKLWLIRRCCKLSFAWHS